MSSSVCSAGAALAEAWLAPNFCVELIPVSVNKPRSVIAVGKSSMLVLERGTSRVLLLKDTNGDGLADSKTTVVAPPEGINHGMALYKGFLYASTESTVYRWKINSSYQRTGSRQTVINKMSTGGHITRTLVFDKKGRLYVSIGSLNNIDADSFRARIRRFTLTNAKFPIDFATGEVFADGLRNEVGLAFDRFGVLWGVENGADQLNRKSLGGDIHNGNPGEELNKFPEADNGKHWGYPWCWSEFDLPEAVGDGVGSVWAWPSTMNKVTDAQCRANYKPSALSMQAHSAPLGITFYKWNATRPAGCKGGFPKTMDGDAFISSHGSWNSDIPVGYKVSYVRMDASGNVPSGVVAKDLVKHTPTAQWPDGFRPVDVSFDTCGRLIVTSDGTNGSGMKVVRISYQANANQCFSGEMTVELDDTSTIPLRDVKVGDIVKVDEGKFEPIYGFGHADPTVSGEYIRFKLSNGRDLVISGNHLVFIPDNKSTPASTLRVGDELVSSNRVNPVTIEAIHTVTGKGAFAPFTYSGTIVVNGIKSSNYISLQNGAAYLTIGNILTPFSHHWLSQSFILPFRLLGSHAILSAWVGWLYTTCLWWSTRHPIVTSLAMIPLITLLGIASLLETLWLEQHHGAWAWLSVLFAAYFIAVKLFDSFKSKKRISV